MYARHIDGTEKPQGVTSWGVQLPTLLPLLPPPLRIHNNTSLTDNNNKCFRHEYFTVLIPKDITTNYICNMIGRQLVHTLHIIIKQDLKMLYK